MRTGYLICTALTLVVGAAIVLYSDTPTPEQFKIHDQSRTIVETSFPSISDVSATEFDDVKVEEIASKSNLPLRLVGTIVRQDPKLSLATVRFIGVDRRENYAQENSIDALGVVQMIKRERLIFWNKATNRLEYIRIGAFDPKLAATSKLIDEAAGGDRELHVERKAVDHALDNLAQVINDASAVPVMSPEGTIVGFRLAYVKPGSIYEKLGLKQGDTLLEVNGTKLNSLATALALYEQLRDSSLINLRIERNSRQSGLTYLIR